MGVWISSSSHFVDPVKSLLKVRQKLKKFRSEKGQRQDSSESCQSLPVSIGKNEGVCVCVTPHKNSEP